MLIALMAGGLLSLPASGHTRKAAPFQSDTAIARGRVVDRADNKPIPGATVTNLRSGKSIFTNTQGEFAIPAFPGDSIRITVAGMQPSTVAYNGEPSLAVSIAKGEATLSEVIVTGYQNIDRKKFAGAAAVVKMDNIKMEGTADVTRMLEGRVAGVAVQNVSGTFGAAPKLRVRGATSLNGDNKPLWVVDGVVLEDIVNISNDQLSSGDPTTLLGSSVAGLNSNDIESFDILKDAAATALYGARAMNGVVVITTKKGKSGKTTVNYNGSYGVQFKPTYGDYNIMNSMEQMSVLAELERKGSLNYTILSRGDIGVYGKMYEALGMNDAGSFDLQNTQPERAAFLKRYAYANTDWFDVLFKNNFVQEHSLSISGGTEKSQNYFSLSYYGDNGWTIADNVNRFTMNFRNNYKFNDRFNAGFSTLGSIRQQKAPGTLARNPNPVEGQYDRDFDINPFSYAVNTSRTLTPYDENGNLEYFRRNYAPFNIIHELDNNYLDINIIDLKLQLDATYKFTDKFRYEFVGAARYVKSTTEHQVTEYSNMANAYRSAGTTVIRQNNKFLYRDPDNPEAEPVVVLPYGGFYNRNEDYLVNYDVRNSLNYSTDIGSKSSLNVLGGVQIRATNRQNYNNTGYGYQYDNGGIPLVDYRILKQTIEQNFPYYGMSKDYDRFVAFYATANYTFDNRFNLTATGRYDGSNRLGSSRQARWLPTWSVAGSWNMEQEKFLEDVSWLDYLTLRASYGLTASMGPATNSNIVLRTINTNRPYLTEKESVITLANLENKDLTWEKMYTSNIGIDASMFNRRLSFSIDAYYRQSYDLISLIKTSGIGGEAYKAANYADMDSYGGEFVINGEIIRKKDWGWRSTLTFGYNKNKIINARNEPTIFSLVVPEGGNKEGYPVRSLFSIRYDGLDHRTGMPNFIDETGKSNNTVYLQDQNTSYLKYEGPVDPPFNGGFSNTFHYKAFSLNIFITYQAGNKIRLYPNFRTLYTDLDAMPKEFKDRWVQPGDEVYTNVPSILGVFEQSRLTGAYPYNNYNYSDVRVASGDFIRLKTVSLSYQFPQKIVQSIKANNLGATISATNPWLIYSDIALKGQDPEFFNAGGVAQPIQKQITLTLKLGF
ncbi:putative TonB-dependent receptor [Flavihumibacter petaseus NBRC 106054]|uniref:Putative TonB-dependent receptor n=2 Tax=Flavihumibacter TaxID=1004301 RepID=A0A0E9N1N7_9BACT|nr:putative TonB-dependent receptor [Flavihumibacter petaseus NBRC 106054]